MGLAPLATDPLLSAGWKRRALLVTALAFAGAVLIFVDAPLCPSAAVFGVPCPGCGLTRATLALLRGDLHAALHFHPLVFVLAPLFAGAMLSALWDYVRGPARVAPSRLRASPWLARAGWLLLALVLGVWVARFFGAFGGPAPVRALGGSPFSGSLQRGLGAKPR
ncbi:MAG: DUF2752 domain-containing protein [Polyangiaceae bacterium]